MLVCMWLLVDQKRERGMARNGSKREGEKSLFGAERLLLERRKEGKERRKRNLS